MAASLVFPSKEYDSGESNNYLLSEEKKNEYLVALQCSKVNKSGSQVETFKTRTSHWVRSNKCRSAAYGLFKVKRWYLTEENLVFDPLNRCEARCSLTPSQTLWRNFHGNENIVEAVISVDNMLNAYLKPDQFDILRKLDTAMAPLQEDVSVQRIGQRDILCEKLLEHISDIPDCAVKSYTDFVTGISTAMHLHVNGVKLYETVFETTFLKFVDCIAECLGGRNNDVRCERNVVGCRLEEIVIPVKKDAKLKIASRPDLFLYKTSNTGIKMLVIGVTEVKGIVNDELVSSDSEGGEHSHDDTQCQHLTKGQNVKKDGTDSDGCDDVEDDSDDDTKDDIETQQKVIKRTPPWLKKISSLPDRAQKALKKLLPQIIGEMMCCARSKAFRAIKAEDGLLLGIGVAGFDIYFVTMLDSCRRTSKSVVNNDSACTQVFVTRPFNIRRREDRQIIIKILTASFQLCKENALI